MAATKNIVIGCLAAVVLVGVIVAGGVGGIFWLGLGAEVDKAVNEGQEFGRRTDQQGCRDEAMRRLRAALRNYDLIKRREVQLFANGCFQSCRVIPDFCTDAPKEDTFFTIRAWSQRQCQKEGFGNDDACVDLFVEVSDACLGKTKRDATTR
jgi:hypothetical protein